MPTAADRPSDRRVAAAPRRRFRTAVAALAAVLAVASAAHAASGSGEEGLERRHGVAMHGEPALPPDFDKLPYADPSAPKGGRVTYGWLGAFDTLNPYAYKGAPVQGLKGAVVESLMARSYAEPFSLYGLVAESVELPDDRSFIVFHINPKARFSDGEAVTAEDVVFTFELLRDRGHPTFRSNYRKVKNVVVDGELSVRFDLGGDEDRELAMILGLMPVLPAHATDAAKFEETTTKAIVGSGPYVVGAVEPGRAVTYRRDPNYWGRDLAVNRGLNNFDEVRYEYYRDSNTMFEAFKKGLIDVRPEGDPTRWATGYDIPAVRDGSIVKENFGSGVPRGMNALVFNTRRPQFRDIRVRQALAMLFDFEWANRNIFGGAFTRTASYYEGSELASTGRPADERERALLAPFPGVVRDDVLDGTWRPASTDGSGRDRDQLAAVLALFEQAGWKLDRGDMRNAETGETFAFEILVSTKDQERIALAYARWVERAGVRATVRLVDGIQAFRRLQTYDFDMTQWNWVSSLSPGTEQKKYWSATAADTPGERNYMGAREPAIDAMIAAILAARERPEFISAVRALDRVLISGFYVVPLFHIKDQWVAHWSRIRRPEALSLYGPILDTWWRAPPAAKL